MLLRGHLILIYFFLVSATSVLAQQTLPDSVDYLTEQLQSHPSAKGLLLNKSMSIFDVGSHTMKQGLSYNAADSLDLFLTSLSAMGKKNGRFPAQWAQQMRDYHHRDTATSIPIVMAMLGVDRIRNDAFTAQKLGIQQGQLKLNEQWDDAMETDTLVWASPLVPSIPHPSHTTFRFDSLHWISNGIQVSSLRWRKLHAVNWSPVLMGANVSFPSVEGKLDTVELEVSCNARVKIIRFTVARTWNQVPNEHVKQWMVQATTSYRTDQVITGYQLQSFHVGGVSFQLSVPIYQQAQKLNKALVSVDYVDQSPIPVLRKPFVIVEGIDFGFELRPNGCSYGRCGSLGYFDFINARKRDYFPNNPDELLPEFALARTFKDSLRRAGYDVVFVDFERGADYIQDNAMVLVEVLRQLRQLMAGNDGMVVCGASMGGLVARYALAWMESKNEPHCVMDFISFDSPQEGANVPLAVQEFVDYTARHNTFNFFDKSVDARNRKFNSPASRQMMLTNYEMPVGLPHPLRGQFLQDLADIGNYPKKLRKIALSNGTLSGTPNMLGVGGNILNLNIDVSKWAALGVSFVTNPLIGFILGNISSSILDYKARLFSLCGSNGLIFEGDAPMFNNMETVYANSGCVAYDHLAGGRSFHEIKDPPPYLNIVQVQHPDFCLIPTSSALGLVPTNVNPVMSGMSLTPGSGIPFEAYWSAATNEKHVNISTAMITFVLARLRESSQQVLTHFTIPQISSVNLGRHTFNSINTSIQIPAGKNLTLHHDRARLGDGTWINPIANSHVSFELGSCKPVECRVLPGGSLIMGNDQWNNAGRLNSTLRVMPGSTLWVEGMLRMEGISTLIIEAGATLKLSAGNLLTLTNSGCHLILHGELKLLPGASFELSTTGWVEIGPQASIDANNSGNFSISGTAADQAVIKFLPQAHLVIPSGVSHCLLANSKLIFADESDLTIHSTSEISEVHATALSFSGPQTGAVRLNIAMNQQVTNSKFEYLIAGLEGFGNASNANFKVINCEFLSCQNGIRQNGGGLDISLSKFLRNNQGILGIGLNQSAMVTTSEFEHNVGGLFLDFSPGKVFEISKSRFTNHKYNAVQIEHGNGVIFNSLIERSASSAILLTNTQVRMTCSQLLNNMGVFELDLGSELDISANAGNVVRNNVSVFLFYHSNPTQPDRIHWKNGKNDFRWNTQLISGNFDDNAISFLPGSVQFVNTRIGPFEFYSVNAQDNLFNAEHPTTTTRLYWNVYGHYSNSSGHVYPIFVEPLAQLSEPFSCGDKFSSGDDAPVDLNPPVFSVSGRPVNSSSAINKTDLSWKAFPNPATQGWIEVSLPEMLNEQEVDLELVDFTGKKIRQWADRQGGSWRLDVSGLATGWYQLLVHADLLTLPPKKVFIQSGL